MIAKFEMDAAEAEFERERQELLKRAAEKPTLRLINAEQAQTIEQLQELHPGQALFIEVTKEDFSKTYEGKLIATAEDSIEFLDLHKQCEGNGKVYLTAYGVSLDPHIALSVSGFEPAAPSPAY